jgi:hypothetical protein
LRPWHGKKWQRPVGVLVVLFFAATVDADTVKISAITIFQATV